MRDSIVTGTAVEAGRTGRGTGTGAPVPGIRGADGRGPVGMRILDGFLILAFLIFAFTSATIDTFLALAIPFRPDAENPIIRWVYHLYAEGNDFLLLENPLFLRIQAGISAFVFGPFYLVLAYAFLRKANWIRVPALMYSAAMVYGMSIVLGVQFFGENPPGDLLVFSLGTLPYLALPLILAWRVRGPLPFGAPGMGG